MQKNIAHKDGSCMHVYASYGCFAFLLRIAGGCTPMAYAFDSLLVISLHRKIKQVATVS